VLNFIEHQQVEARYAASFQQHINEAHNITDIQLRERELQRIIDKEIAALPPKMREVFLLSRKEYLSHKEIAIRLNISEHTVKNHIKAALKTLRQSLGFTFLVALHYLL
jgi:RNA polymerase sigma-70 factor (ECF subfamily)